jgi:hypothetical protein
MSAVIECAVPPMGASVVNPGRYNIYSVIHKGLRGFMVDTLLRLGRVDVADPCEAGQLVAQMRSLLAFCLSHVRHENEFVHPALERAQPYASTGTADEHIDHVCEIGAFERRITAFEAATVAERMVLAQALYLDLSTFVGENFAHMKMEETHNQAVLLNHYTDEQLRAIDGAIVESIPPAELMLGLRWMIGHITASERAFLLGGMKRVAPAEAFEAAMQLAGEVLSERDYYKLTIALN